MLHRQAAVSRTTHLVFFILEIGFLISGLFAFAHEVTKETILAALEHQFWDKDNSLRRLMPGSESLLAVCL